MTEIDAKQRVRLISLRDNAKLLKKKVSYDQLQPYLTSVLHKVGSGDHGSDDVVGGDDGGDVSDDDASGGDVGGSDDDGSGDHVEGDCEDGNEDGLWDHGSWDHVDGSSNRGNHFNDCGSDSGCRDRVKDDCGSGIQVGDDGGGSGIRVGDDGCNDDHGSNQQKKSGTSYMYAASIGNTGKLVLTVLKENFWLSDEHIDHAQWLIGKQYPGTNGLHSVLAFESKTVKVQQGLANFVQVLNISGDHWVTVSNIGCDVNHIKVYDSFHRRILNQVDRSF